MVAMLGILAGMSSAVTAIGAGFGGLGALASKVWNTISTAFNDYIKKPIEDFFDWFEGIWDDLSTWADEAFDFVMTEFLTKDYWTGPDGLLTNIYSMFPDWDELFSFVPEGIFTKEYWTGEGGVFDFDWPSWSEIFSFILPEWLLLTIDFISGEGAFAGFTLSERLDFAFDLPDWLTTTLDFMTGDGVFAGFSISDRIDLVIGELPQPFKFIADLFTGLFNIKISDFVDFGISLKGGAWDFVTGLIDDPAGTFAGVGIGITTFFTGVGDTLGGILKAPINSLIGLINSLFAAMKFTKTISNPFTGTDYTFGMDLSNWSITPLAKGGIINKPTLGLIGEDGPEAVIPLSQRNNPGGAGMGGTVNVTVNASGITDRSDKRALAREIGNMIQNELARNIGGTTMRGR